MTKPKTKLSSYEIVTIGCQMNQADSQRLAAFLNEAGFRPARKGEKASAVIINTCGVRQSAEDRVYGLAEQFRQRQPQSKIIITGCLSRRADVRKRLAGRADLFLPINEMFQLPDILSGKEFSPFYSLEEFRRRKGEPYLKIRPEAEQPGSVYLPIGNGCDNFCSYCVVPYARGREVYRPFGDIVKDAQALVASGIKEIVLLAQNVNSYRSRGKDFADLLARLDKIPGDFWLRFASSHPKDMSLKLVRQLGRSDKVCRHLHLAVQSGDDEILRAMNRRYTAKHYLDLLAKVRRHKPGISITTDAIVGFPGEARKQFLNTAKLFRQAAFALAYIAQYSPRPGTAAAELSDDVPRAEKKRREGILTGILRRSALAENKKFLGQSVRVLVEGKNRQGRYYGKTSEYKTVVFSAPLRPDLSGRFVEVEITAAQDFGLQGKLV